MACSITNLQVIAIGPSGGGPSSSITISGHAEDCEKVLVNFSCGGVNSFVETIVVDPVTGDWSVTTDTPVCACTKPFTLIVQCSGNQACQAVLNGVLQCAPAGGCPSVNSVSITANAVCQPDGLRRSVSFSTIITNSTMITGSATWEFEPGIFGLPMNLNPGSNTHVRTYNYLAPGSYTATLHITLPDGCPPQSYPLRVDACPPRCLNPGDVVITIAPMCNPDGTRNVTFTLPFSANVHFDFGDSDFTDIVGSSASNNYAPPGPYTATITVEGCPPIQVPVGPLNLCDGPPTGACCLPDKSCTETTESDCVARGGTYNGDGVFCAAVNCNPGGGGGGGSSSACGAFTFIIAGLMAIAMATTLVFIALQFCLGVPVPPWLWGVVIGIWAAVAVAIALWYLICALVPGCPCPKACDWLVIAWVPTLAAAIIALYLSGCCILMLWISIGLFAEAILAFVIWKKRCKPGKCRIFDLLALAIVTGVGTTLGYLVLVPIIGTCGLSWVPAVAGTLAALIVTIQVACHASE